MEGKRRWSWCGVGVGFRLGEVAAGYVSRVLVFLVVIVEGWFMC